MDGADIGMIVCFSIFLAAVFGIYCMMLPGIKKKKKYGEIENYIEFDEKTNTLILIRRSTYIKDWLTVRKDNSIQTNYKPEKIHVGAATVGGVTTGGAYKTGGYTYDTLVESGYYQLLFIKPHTGLCKVEHIKLDVPRYTKALRSQISPYLNKRTREIDVVAEVTFTDSEKQMMLNNLKWNGYVGDMAKKGYPSKEKCEQIRDWLSEVDE